MLDPESQTYKFLKALPKCEHHMHIEGALEPETLFELSKTNKIPLDPKYYTTPAALRERYLHFTGLDDFLFYRNTALEVLLHRDDFETLAFTYMTRAHKDGVVHAEVFFDPQSHTSRGVSLDDVVEGLQSGLERGEKEYGMSAALVMCIEKHRTLESCMEAVASATPYVESGVIIGLGMDSTEKDNPPEKYAGVYELARTLGYPNYTGHAGEEGEASSVRTAVFEMGINRIDHGTRAAEDPQLLKDLAQRKTFLTICPLSNVSLKVIKDVTEEPILAFMEAGIKLSINSDDPSYFSGLLENYIALHEAFHFSKEVWAGLMHDAIEYSWCSEDRKIELYKLLDAMLLEWKDKEI